MAEEKKAKKAGTAGEAAEKKHGPAKPAQHAAAVKKHEEHAKPAVEQPKAAQQQPAKKPAKAAAPEKARISKSAEVKRLARLVRKKKRPMFRGRFGNRSIRNIADKKWQRWRVPRGEDIHFRQEDGLVPNCGYRTPLSIRFVHPSGYREQLVRNVREIEALEARKASVAARIMSNVGRKKRAEMLRRAAELKIVVLNG